MAGAVTYTGCGAEQVVLCQDRASGLKAVIAIHSTALGPALGGTRFYPYATRGVVGLVEVGRGSSRFQCRLRCSSVGGAAAATRRPQHCRPRSAPCGCRGRPERPGGPCRERAGAPCRATPDRPDPLWLSPAVRPRRPCP
ncbi:Glu/Leu/Phe/Val dehydrogenase dimerization domain-containing protein [Streptomyces bottropensis]|uniref:Glu/Leu/Phe/Val dehydrogenase dimerization domain-containing protein n=1 Tax=Streptomyces bottropensis TaxID=42235 RepID=UPI0037F1C73C